MYNLEYGCKLRSYVHGRTRQVIIDLSYAVTPTTLLIPTLNCLMSALRVLDFSCGMWPPTIFIYLILFDAWVKRPPLFFEELFLKFVGLII